MKGPGPSFRKIKPGRCVSLEASGLPSSGDATPIPLRALPFVNQGALRKALALAGPQFPRL